MTRTFLKIFAFMLAVVGIYAYVGQLVPQFEEHPPAKKVVTPETPREELVAIGEELVRGKGGCLICHKVTDTGNERGPDLRQVAGKAATRKPGMTAGAYVIESLVKPDAFLVSGYPNMMPSALKPPANLSMAEVKAIVVYLQSLAGQEPSVKVMAGDVSAAATVAGPQHRGRALLAQHGCLACHKVEADGGSIGPDLTRAASAREPGELFRKIAEPALWTAPGFPAGVMPRDYAQRIPEGERHEMVAYLATLAGKSYSATGAASPWSHEGVRLGLVVFVFNAGMLVALGLARRRKRGDA